MIVRKCDIRFTITMDGEEYYVDTYTGEYRNLMALITDKIYVEDFGECKGMGRCGTCIVEILPTPNKFVSFERNEDATIKKTGITNSNHKLACQILVTEELTNSRVQIRTN